MNNVLLNSLAYYVTDKIPASNVDSKTYIGVDNMLPNCGGITVSDYEPCEGYVTKFMPGDILIGNIRPYFKKIWRATFEGGCSSDVLVIRSNGTVSSKYLYACLATQHFFDYDLAGSKGSKMPRGDKNHIMQYTVPLLDSEVEIGDFIDDINSKILLNESICLDLESMAKTIYDYWFLQFEFPNKDGKPYKSSGGKMVWSDELKREIPEGWKVKSVDEAGVYVTDYTANGSFKSLADNVKYNEGTPYALLVRIVDFNNNFEKGNDFVYVNKHAYDFLSKSALNPDDIIICNVGAVGNIYRCPDLGMPMTLGPNGIVLRHDTLENYLFTHFSSQLGQNQIKSISSGSIQEKFNKTNFRDLKLAIPDKMTLSKFDNLYCSLYEQSKTLWQENQELASLRDFLLPLLMNGQVTFKEEL